MISSMWSWWIRPTVGMRTSPFRVSSWWFGKLETADLFLSVIMYRLKKNGRAAVVVPDGFLFGLDNAKVNIKKKLISQFNLHTVVRLPGSVFSPYTSITTNLLFWQHQADHRDMVLSGGYSVWQKALFQDEAHGAEALWWLHCLVEWSKGNSGRRKLQGEEVYRRYLLNEQGCNIDLCGYPHEEEEILDPIDTIREYQERRTTLNAEIDKVLAELEALLPGGVSEWHRNS